MRKLLCLFLLVFFSCSNTSNDKSNNIFDVQIGMKLSIVDSIMGKPIKVEFPKHDTCCFVYEYSAAIGGSENSTIWFSKNDSMVVDFFYGG